MTSLRGKVVVLTGAASGIGLATAHLLASHGALLSLADINTTQLAEVAAELNKQYQSEYLELNPKVVDQIIFSTVDIRSRVACEDWISRTQAHFGQAIAGAANLAGAFGRSIAQEKGSIRNITDEECDFVMDVNCKGLLNCLRAQLPHMRAGTAGRSGGSIVNAASIGGVVGVENNGPYVASKHAVVGITRTVAKEEGPRAIRVNAIAPGIIATPMIKQIEECKGSTELFGAGDPGALARKGDASEVAEVIVFLLSDSSSFVNGVVLPIDGGWMC